MNLIQDSEDEHAKFQPQPKKKSKPIDKKDKSKAKEDYDDKPKTIYDRIRDYFGKAFQGGNDVSLV